MGAGLARDTTVQYQANVATGATPVGTISNVHGYAFASFQVIGLGDGLGNNLAAGAGSGLGAVQIEGTLAMESSTITWVALSVTNINMNQTIGNITSDGIYTTTLTPFFNYMRARVVTLTSVVGSGVNVFGIIQSQTDG